jgi:hypothetical protein
MSEALMIMKDYWGFGYVIFKMSYAELREPR